MGREKALRGIMVILMPGVFSDALLVLHQMEAFKSEKTDKNIYHIENTIPFRQDFTPPFPEISERLRLHNKKKEPEIKHFRPLLAHFDKIDARRTFSKSNRGANTLST